MKFIEKAEKIHNNFYDYSLVDYKNCNTKVKIICPIHGIFLQIPHDHLSGRGCPKCAGKYKKTTSEFISEAKQVHFDKYDYSLSEFKNVKTKIKIICPIHGEFEQLPNSHLKGSGCPNCAGKNKSTFQFISEAKQIHGSRYDYSLSEYKNAKTKVKIICPIHGVFEQTPSNHLHKTKPQGCPKCKESNLEKQTRTWLEKNNFEFTSQKKFDNLKDTFQLSYDFYVPSKNLLIECNGEQHYKQKEFFGGRKKFLLQKHHDWLKRDFAKKNNIDLLVIKFDENVDEKLFPLISRL